MINPQVTPQYTRTKAAYNPGELPQKWRAEAEAYERDGALVSASTLLLRLADEFETAVWAYEQDELTIAEAAKESGYTEDHLRTLVREGTILDQRPSGSEGWIRIRRCDLPRKPGLASGPQPPEDDFASRVVANRKGATHG